jgi:hypothetical protein
MEMNLNTYRCKVVFVEVYKFMSVDVGVRISPLIAPALSLFKM